MFSFALGKQSESTLCRRSSVEGGCVCAGSVRPGGGISLGRRRQWEDWPWHSWEVGALCPIFVPFILLVCPASQEDLCCSSEFQWGNMGATP